jgi:hypothetical protein
MTGVGSRFVLALAAKDTEALLEIFAPDVQFRGMTPHRFWEANSPRDAVENVLYDWFGSDDIVEEIEQLEEGRIVDRPRVDYRLHIRNPDGLFAVEQRAYLDLDDDGRVARMNVMCAGYRQIGESTA